MCSEDRYSNWDITDQSLAALTSAELIQLLSKKTLQLLTASKQNPYNRSEVRTLKKEVEKIQEAFKRSKEKGNE